MTFDFERFAVQNAEREFGVKIPRRSPREGLPCPQCDRTAWHDPSQDRGDGVRVFMCAAGDVLIVAPIAVKA